MSIKILKKDNLVRGLLSGLFRGGLQVYAALGAGGKTKLHKMIDVHSTFKFQSLYLYQMCCATNVCLGQDV